MSTEISAIDDLKQLLKVLKLNICLEQFLSIAEQCEKERKEIIRRILTRINVAGKRV